MGVGNYHFTVPEERDKKIAAIIRDKAKNHEASSFIVSAIIEKHERECFKPINDFVQPELELDSMPRIWEIVKKEDLEDLSPRDIGRLYRTMHMNLDTVRKIINSSNDSQEEIKARLVE